MALSGKITALLEKIAADRVSGAAQIGDLAVDCFLELPAESDEKTLRALLRQLLASQPEMAPLYILCMAAIEVLSPQKEFSLPAIKEKALQFRSSYGLPKGTSKPRPTPCLNPVAVFSPTALAGQSSTCFLRCTATDWISDLSPPNPGPCMRGGSWRSPWVQKGYAPR